MLKVTYYGVFPIVGGRGGAFYKKEGRNKLKQHQFQIKIISHTCFKARHLFKVARLENYSKR